MTDTQMKVRIVTVTPEIAEGLLKRNTRNRSVYRNRIEQYAADIRRGAWQVNGEAIKVATDGTILDGQHRLIACTEADAPFTTLLITGLPPEAQETMDQGRPRSFADVLKLRGESEYFSVASATRIVLFYERDGVPYQPIRTAPPSIDDMSRTLDRNPEIRDSVRFCAQHKVAWFGYSILAGMHYLFSVADADAVDTFIGRLTTGLDLTAGDPVWVLRERLILEHARGANALRPRVKLAFLVRAWNARRDGDTIRRLDWSPGDRFPRISGLASRVGADQERAA